MKKLVAAAGLTLGVVALTGCHTSSVIINSADNPDTVTVYDNDYPAGGVGLGFNCSTREGDATAIAVYVEGEWWKPPGETGWHRTKRCPTWAPFVISSTVTHWQFH
jgi:hypothetical protein